MNEKELFIELRSTLNKTLNELLESHQLTYGDDSVINNWWYGERINDIYYQIDKLVEKINNEELKENQNYE